MQGDRLRGRAGRLLLGLAGRIGLWRRWERWLDPVLERLLPGAGGVFVDVGVHLGQTLLKVKRLAPGMRYLGFEPNLAALEQARALVRRHRLPGCDIYPFALGEAVGVADLRTRGGDADSAASIVAGFRDASFYGASRPVALAAGDDVLESAGARPAALIKVDVEGGELEVLSGLGRTLAGDRPPVLCEVLPLYEAESDLGRFRAGRQGRLEGLLSGLDYRILRIGRDGRLHPVAGFGVHQRLDACDYLFMPAEQSGRVADLVASEEAS